MPIITGGGSGGGSSLPDPVTVVHGGTGDTTASGARTNLGLGTAATTASTDYAVAAKGVTNGDSHDHNGGDGAQVAYSTLSGTPSLGDAAAKNTGTTTGTLAAGDDSRFPASSDIADADISASADVMLSSIEYVIDGGGSAITTGLKGFLEVPFNCTINRATLLADQSGSIVIDIWKDSYANFPPTGADTITASAKPTLSSAQGSQNTTLTGWTTAITAGDILAFNVDSASTVTRVVLSLKVTKT